MEGSESAPGSARGNIAGRMWAAAGAAAVALFLLGAGASDLGLSGRLAVGAGALLFGLTGWIIGRIGGRPTAGASDTPPEPSSLTRPSRAMESVLNRSGAVLFLWRNEGDWPIEYVSDNVAVFGHDPRALMAERRPYGSLIHPDDAGHVHRSMRAFMAEGRNEYRLHYRLFATDGSARWVDEHGLILRDAGGHADRVQGVVIDVTERHRAEEQLRVYRTRLEAMVRERTGELQAANRRLRKDIALRHEAEEARRTMEREVSAAREREMLEQADRLSALGLLATGVAHEVNNPLQGMLSHLQAVRHALPPDFRRTESLEAVERGIESIAGLVQRLLWLGAGQEDDRPASRLADAVAFVRELLEPGLRRRGIRLEVKQAAADRSVAVPTRELVQILLNLLLNARDAMPDGGVITVACDADEERARVTVSDTGIGIAPDIRSRIFAPFFTTKGNQGTGLGLSVAASLVQARRGRIEVDSEPGKGSAFTLHLPLAEETDHEAERSDRR